MTTESDRDYYCFRKFSELFLNFPGHSVASCCAATEKKIDFVDLQKNNLLNLTEWRNDREQMLNNQRVQSCEQACWNNEDHGLPSARSIHPDPGPRHTESTITELPTCNIKLGSRCLLTCIYCGPQHSRAWSSDIEINGAYTFDYRPQITISPRDQLLSKISQDYVLNSSKTQILYDKLKQISHTVKRWYITGGETLLYDTQVLDLIKISDPNSEFTVMTGLGLPKNKFTRIIDQLKEFPNFRLGISAENIGQFHEFNRFGYSFDHFVDLLQYIKSTGITYQFYSTLSNVTAFGYVDFVNFVESKIEQQLCTAPEFLALQNMDIESKHTLLEQLHRQNNKQFSLLINCLETEHQTADSDRQHLAEFLQQFAARRSLDVSIFPQTFLKWLNIHVVQ